MASVFLSYAREDRTFAACLARTLEAAGHRVWWDRRLDGGEEFAAEIEAELNASEVVIVAWSAQSVKSRWVRDEASVGGDRGCLVPVTIDGTLPPMGFRQFHTLDLRAWKGSKRDQRTAELLHSVSRRLGSEPARPAPPESATAQKRSFPKRPMAVWGAALIAALVLAAAAAFLVSRRENVAETAKPTIALVPFTTASADPQLRALASEVGDSLTHSFSESGLPLRLPDAGSKDGRTGTDFIISGDLSMDGDKIVATVHLDEAAHRVTVFSHKFEASGTDVPNLAERVGAQMAGDLTWAAPLLVLDQVHRLDPALMADLLGGYDFTADPLTSYEAAKRVAAKSPNIQIAQLTAAFDTSFVLDQIPRSERAQAVAEARSAADRALKLGPGFGDTYGTWCMLHSEAMLAQCERHLRAGRQVDPDAPFLNSFLSQLLRGVGRFEEAIDLAKLSYSHDRYVPTKIGWMLLSAEYQGDRDGAHHMDEQGVRWWPEFSTNYANDRLRGRMERGDLDSLPALEKEIGTDRLTSSYVDSGALTIDWRSQPAVRRFCSGTQQFYPMARCMLVLGRYGDLDDAYAIANKLYPRRVGRSAAETESIWLDEPDAYGWTEFATSAAAAPLRRDPRYLDLAERTGLLAYWRTAGPPDFCRVNPEPICPQLLKRH